MTLDPLLPERSGVDLPARPRPEGHTAKLPVIVLPVVAEEGAVAGFTVSDVLAKPIDTAALLDALRRAGVVADRRGAGAVGGGGPGGARVVGGTRGRPGVQTHCRPGGGGALGGGGGRRPG